MNHNITIQLKAALLVAVFSLNMVVGFACSIGVNMGYNTHHHQEQAELSSSMTHQEHQENNKCHHHAPAQLPVSSDDDCCSHEVTSFNLLTKAVPDSISVISPVLFVYLPASYFYIDALQSRVVVKNIRAFTQSYHPPIQDIRVAIQSFLI